MLMVEGPESPFLIELIQDGHLTPVSQEHLVYYRDEHTFRFNRRSSNSRSLLSYRLQQAVITDPTPTR